MCFILRDSPYIVHFKLGTVPTLCILIAGTVATWCLLNLGTVPRFSPPPHFVLLRNLLLIIPGIKQGQTRPTKKQCSRWWITLSSWRCWSGIIFSRLNHWGGKFEGGPSSRCRLSRWLRPQMSQLDIKESASKETQSNVCLYPYPFGVPWTSLRWM